MDEQELKRIFSDNLNYLLRIRNQKQIDLANDLHLKQQTVNSWCIGVNIPRANTIQKIADYFGVGLNDLLEPRKLNVLNRGVKIPVLGRVQAGLPVEAIEEIIDYEEIDVKLAGTGEFFGLQIRGNSMEPKFSDGDVVIVKKQPDVESGQIAVVIVNGSDATVKRIKKINGGIMLISLNPAYEPMFYSEQDILDLPVEIIGRAIELRAKL